MDLPGGQNALVEAVLDANPDTIVVVNAASPVAMPWADRVKAVLISWFGGQEMAGALADVLTGAADPGGRLPTTQPLQRRAQPVVRQLPGRERRGPLRRGRPVGYRWYDARHLPVRFPFGHGLSYATFEIGEPRVAAASFTPGSTLTVELDVTNTSDRPGFEVVQLYVEPPPSELVRPPRELRALRQGPPRAGRDHDRLAHPHRPGLRLLGPGRPELGVPAPPGRGLPDDPGRRGAPHHGRLANRPGHLRPVGRPLLRGPPPCGSAAGRLSIYARGLSVPGRYTSASAAAFTRTEHSSRHHRAAGAGVPVLGPWLVGANRVMGSRGIGRMPDVGASAPA